MKKLINAYYRLFYFYFRIEKRGYHGIEESDKSATIMALMPICLFCYCDFFTVLYIFSRFLIPLPKPSHLFHGIIAVIFVVMNYLFFFRKKRYIAIKEMFQRESENTRIKRSFWCIAFSLASLFTMFLLIAEYGLPWTK
jgi:hypothetical protein